MNTLTIELPVEGLPSPAELPDNFADEARFLLALKLFELGRISSGKAGRLEKKKKREEQELKDLKQDEKKRNKAAIIKA